VLIAKLDAVGRTDTVAHGSRERVDVDSLTGYVCYSLKLGHRPHSRGFALQNDRALRANVAAEVRGIKDDPIHRGYALTSVSSH
jgi:hypothetical protein